MGSRSRAGRVHWRVVMMLRFALGSTPALTFVGFGSQDSISSGHLHTHVPRLARNQSDAVFPDIGSHRIVGRLTWSLPW